MADILAYINPHDIVTISRVNTVELIEHLAFGTESLNDSKSSKSLIYHAHSVTP